MFQSLKGVSIEISSIFIFHFCLEDTGKEKFLSNLGYCLLFVYFPRKIWPTKSQIIPSLKLLVSREIGEDHNFSYLGRDVKAH